MASRQSSACFLIWLLILCGSAPVVCQELPIYKGQPHWQRNLKEAGIRVAKRGFVNDPGSTAALALSNENLLVAFDSYEQDARRITLAIYDSRTGALKGAEMMPERIPFGYPALWTDVKATAAGNFLVCLPNGVALYSPELKRLHQATWSAPRHSEHESWAVFFSPSGRGFGVSHQVGEEYEFEIFDAETFQKLVYWTETNAAHPVGMADHAFVKYPPTDRDGRLAVRTWEGPWHPLCSTDDCKGNPRFLNDDMLVLADPQQGVQVVTVDGKILLSDKLLARGQAGFLRPAETSADGQRFAIDFHGPQGRVGWWEEFVFKFQKLALVYDVAAGRVIFALPVRPFPMYWNVELALAPDGSLLAVLNQGKLKVYRLPGK